ncbi:hypothetical protein FOFC_05262 [Fusarium oxysporum]|nr:hypothetical protein FOFC_05262 [Fusarium oxysporum]
MDPENESQFKTNQRLASLTNALSLGEYSCPKRCSRRKKSKILTLEAWGKVDL